LPQAKDITEEEKKSALAKILKKAKELNMDELLKKYEKSEEADVALATPEETKPAEVAGTETKPVEASAELVPETVKEKAQEVKEECPCIEEKPTKVVSEYTSICIDTYDETTGSYKSESRGHTRTVKTFKDGREEITDTDNNSLYDSYVEKYTVTKAELEEVKVAQDELVAAMPKEVSDKIKELIKDGKSMKEAMKQAWDEYKKSQEKASEEKDTELKNKTEELGKKDQEIADLKNPKPEDKKEKVLTVGNVEVKDRNKEVQKGIDDRAFGKR
jgi:hypothetical protein